MCISPSIFQLRKNFDWLWMIMNWLGFCDRLANLSLFFLFLPFVSALVRCGFSMEDSSIWRQHPKANCWTLKHETKILFKNVRVWVLTNYELHCTANFYPMKTTGTGNCGVMMISYCLNYAYQSTTGASFQFGIALMAPIQKKTIKLDVIMVRHAMFREPIMMLRVQNLSFCH